MKQRYMDFVPKNKNSIKPAKKPVSKKPAQDFVLDESVVAEPVVTEEPAIEQIAAEELVMMGPEELSEAKSELEEVNIEEFFAVDTNSKRRDVEYGVVEEYRPKFVRTDIDKRPLGQPDAKFAKKDEIKEVKAKKLVGKKAETVSAPAKKAEEKKADDTLKVPKTRFVNTDKIEKRPLSKNVYKKKIVTPKEEPKGPVTIISKPDDGSRVGVIVTIILTIILGAAAGTVAFLLLPK